MGEALFHRAVPPFIILDNRLPLPFDGFSKRYETFGGIRPPIQQHVLDEFEQFFWYFLVNSQLAGVHDAHIESRLDGMIEKGRVHRLPHGVVPAERKRNVADAAAD